jgi:hypothetical protein
VHLPKLKIEIAHGARFVLSLAAVVILDAALLGLIPMDDSLREELLRIILPREDANDVLPRLDLQVVVQTSTGARLLLTTLEEFFVLLTQFIQIHDFSLFLMVVKFCLGSEVRTKLNQHVLLVI